MGFVLSRNCENFTENTVKFRETWTMIFGKLVIRYPVLMCFSLVRFLFKLIEVSIGN